jgi:sugar phosphate isomerase/epimerase
MRGGVFGSTLGGGMDKHWDAYCGLSLVHFLAFPEYHAGDDSVLRTVERVVMDDFFSAIEISRINNPTLRKEVASLIAQTHTKVDFGAHPMILGDKLNLNSLVPQERNKARKALEPYVDQAAELGAHRFVLLSGPDPGAANRGAAREALVSSLQCLCEYARPRNVSVVLETFDREIDKKALIGPAEEAASVARELRRDFPDFALLYDMGHMVLLDEKPVTALRTLKEFLCHVHVGNCVKVSGRPSYGDHHPRFGFPGSENDVKELVDFLQALFEVGYLTADPPPGNRPAVGFEIKPQPGESSAAILANLKRAWREAWPQV